MFTKNNKIFLLKNSYYIRKFNISLFGLDNRYISSSGNYRAPSVLYTSAIIHHRLHSLVSNIHMRIIFWVNPETRVGSAPRKDDALRARLEN